MKIGAHVSIAGNLTNAIKNAQSIGANTIQIFVSAPQNWYPSKITQPDIEAFNNAAETAGINPILIHAIYLINLASDNPELITKSKQSLIDALNISAKIYAAGVIFHIGSHKTKTYEEIKPQIIQYINNILTNSDPQSTLIIETNAGQGNCVGCTFEQIAEIIAGIDQKNRIGVCLDTAHVFASGYDIKNQPTEVIKQFDQIIGLNYLKAIHCNDSKSDFNSRTDRHENIGQGQIGEAAFKKLLHLPELKDIPFILEVPGFDNHGPDNQNIEILKKLAK